MATTQDDKRLVHLRRALGAELFGQVQRSKVLMVGAGGIGCELLKDLVMAGFERHIEIVDLDTIDLSNLNRQFLFQKQHISKSKAHIARESALRFNPKANILSHHMSIMDTKFSPEFIGGFDIVLNALDNLAARRHVNRLCLAAGVPLVESGSAGYLGQVTVIKKGESECFECQPKPVPKTFPVCTIRSTPSAPIHCVVWAKDYLFAQLFGKNADEGEDDSAPVNPDAENAEELKALKVEANALQILRQQIGASDFAAAVFKKVFHADVLRLVSMKDMWKKRAPPSPLDYDALSGPELKHAPASSLDDQRVWSTAETFGVFLESLTTLSTRYIGENKPEWSFDKDDIDMLNFVTATANLRATVYGIEQQSRFTIKSMAGNIIPAIATTNAIVAGLIVMETFHVLASQFNKCNTTYLAHGGRRPKLLMKERLAEPNKGCYVCQNRNVTLDINTDIATLRVLVHSVLQKLMALVEPSVQDGGRLLYDVEFEDNLDKTLKELQLVDGTLLSVSDDTQDYRLVINIRHQETFASAETLFAVHGGATPPPPVVAAATAPAAPADSGKKRKLEEDDTVNAADDDADAMELIVMSEADYNSQLNANKKARTANADDDDDVL